MPYAVTLPLDDAAANYVRMMWQALAEQAGSSGAIRLGYIPHITLAVLAHTAPVEEVAEAVFGVAAGWTALPIVLAGLGIFPGTPPVIFAAPVVTSDLLTKHAELYAAVSPFTVHPHYAPGSWVPHITLSKDGTASAARVVETVSSVWTGPINTRLERVELLRFRPVEILRSQPLQRVG